MRRAGPGRTVKHCDSPYGFLDRAGLLRLAIDYEAFMMKLTESG